MRSPLSESDAYPPNDGFEQIIISHHHLPRLTVASSIPAAAMNSRNICQQELRL